MINNDYKIICSDLDGTLINNNHKFSLFTKFVLNKVVRNNVFLIINSGRILQSLIKISKKLNVINNNVFLIANNGATLYSCKLKKILKEFLFSKHDVIEIFYYLNSKKFYLNFLFFSNNNIFSSESNFISKLWSKIMKAPYCILNNKKTIFNLFNDSISRLLINFNNAPEKKIIEILFFLKKNFNNFYIIRLNDFLYEIKSCYCSKGTSLYYIARILNVSEDNIFAFGDSFSDLEMFKFAKHKLVVKNAKSIIKSKATKIIFSNENDGVAIYLYNKLNKNKNNGKKYEKYLK